MRQSPTSASRREWAAPKLEKLGAMRDVAASLNAPGNGNSSNGTTAPS